MADSFVILGFGLIILGIFLLIILKGTEEGENKVNLKKLYSKSNFKKTTIKKNIEKDRRDKEEIIEYETRGKVSEETKNGSDTKTIYSELNQDHIKNNNN